MRPITEAPQLLYLLNPQVQRSLNTARATLAAEVCEAIDELLVDGATLEQVAARLHRPVRRLREQLSQADVRFNDMLNDCRCRLAKQLLQDTDTRIELIAERTGFSEPSTFHRAFKRWLGETPVEFRRRARQANGRCDAT